MQKHIVYLATDANRAYIAVDYCQNIAHRLFELSQSGMPFFSGNARIGRIVYMEEFATIEEAHKRKDELSAYTHMMKERIIRRSNPNWLNIAPIAALSRHKKVVAYASA